MFSNKAQIQSIFLKFILGILIFFVIFLFVADSIEKMEESNCSSEYDVFIRELNSVLGKLSFGDRIFKKFSMPCGSDKVIFVDSGINQPLLALKEFPLLNNELRSNTANVFFFKDGSLKGRYFLDDVTMTFPYFNCFSSQKNSFAFEFEYDGKNKFYGKKDRLYDCGIKGPGSIGLRMDDIQRLLGEIMKNSKEYDHIDPKDFMDSSRCNVTREFVESESGTETEIILRKEKGCSLNYFEKIPKCAISSLQIAIDGGFIEFEENLDFEVLDDDPLMVWHFKKDDDEMLYSIKKFIDESCKDQFLSAASEHKDFGALINESLKILEPLGGDLTLLLRDLENTPFTDDPLYAESVLALLDALVADKQNTDMGIDKNEIENIVFSLESLIDGSELTNSKKTELKNEINILGLKVLAVMD